VSHLEEQISALVDGELTGAELDRANAHLAACPRCRVEAAELRQLKTQLRALAAPWDSPAGAAFRAPMADGVPGHRPASAEEALTRRLLAMAGPGGPVPSRRFRREQFRYARQIQRGGRPPLPPRVLRRRGRYVLWSAVSLVVVGIGTAAFSMGGGGSVPGPKITPQLEMFSLEHAIQTGDIPFPEPTQAPTSSRP
jgi:anti-sigma factor RsiW